MIKLELNHLYIRKEIHSIFSPKTTFTSQRGPWGARGYASIPNRKGDYVFMSSFGAVSEGIIFKEQINEDGTFDWQSQKQQSLTHKVVLDWINHDELINNIYYFYNSGEKRDGVNEYKYMGLLKYLYHDPKKESPVHFQWQLINWKVKDEKNIGAIKTISNINNYPGGILVKKTLKNGNLIKGEMCPLPKSLVNKKIEQRTKKIPRDYASQEAKNIELGGLGEKLVIKYEIGNLKKTNHDLDKFPVIHVSEKDPESPYDIESYDENGKVKYIEVKTTRSKDSTPFYISAGELKFGREHSDNYYIYRVYDYNDDTDSGKFYIVYGTELDDKLDFKALNYLARLK